MLSTLKYSIPDVRPALYASGLLLAADYVMGKSQTTNTQLLYDAGGLFISIVSAKIVADLIPDFGDSKLGGIINKGTNVLLPAVLSTVFFEYYYDKVVRGNFPLYSGSLRSPMENSVLSFSCAFAGNLVDCYMMRWIM